VGLVAPWCVPVQNVERDGFQDFKVLPPPLLPGVSLDTKFVNVDSGADKALICLLLAFLDHAVQHGPKAPRVRGGATNLAYFTHGYLGLNAGITVLEVHTYRESAHLVVADVIVVALVEELPRGGAQELQLGAAEDVINDFLSVPNMVVVVARLGFGIQSHSYLPSNCLLVHSRSSAQVEVEDDGLLLCLPEHLLYLSLGGLLSRDGRSRGSPRLHSFFTCRTGVGVHQGDRGGGTGLLLVHLARVDQSRCQILLRLQEQRENLSDSENGGAKGAILGAAALLNSFSHRIQQVF